MPVKIRLFLALTSVAILAGCSAGTTESVIECPAEQQPIQVPETVQESESLSSNEAPPIDIAKLQNLV